MSMDEAQRPTERCLQDVGLRLGVSRNGYAVAFWATAVFSAALTFNVYSRTQQWHFNLPFAPSFEEPSFYGVAAIGTFAGGALLLIVIAMLCIYADQWGRCYRTWVGRVPSFSVEIGPSAAGSLLPVIHAVALVIVVGFPLVGQIHFVDKFVAGSATTKAGELHAGWRDHLFKWVPFGECGNFVYDGKDGLAFCEFYEPWAVVIFSLATFVAAAFVLYRLFHPSVSAPPSTAPSGASSAGPEC